MARFCPQLGQSPLSLHENGTVLARAPTGKRAELTDQMGRIEEAEVDRGVCPAQRTRVVQTPDDTLKAYDAREALRRHANFVGETALELAHGETDF
jgi:hypothetical protein